MSTLYVILIVLATIYPFGAFFTALELAHPWRGEPRPGRERLLRTVFWPWYSAQDIYRHYRKDW